MTLFQLASFAVEFFLFYSLIRILLSVLGSSLKIFKGAGSQARKVPGSLGWPIVGHLPYIDLGDPYPLCKYYKDKYGPIFRMSLGSWNAVVFMDFHQIKRVCQSSDFSSRPMLSSTGAYSKGFQGFLLSRGPLWTEHRRFVVQQLSNMGLGKSNIGDRIQREAEYLCDEFKKNLSKPIDLGPFFNMSIVNIISAVVAGDRMDYSDPKFLNLVKLSHKVIQVNTAPDLFCFAPWITRILPRWAGWLLGADKAAEANVAFYDYVQEMIKEHKVNLDPDNPRDYVDAFLIKQMKNPDSTFTDEQLEVCVADFFLAGGDTTPTMLRWMFLFLGMYPSVQKKVQEEMERVVGVNIVPTLKDQVNMPYTTAVILESLRFGDGSPMGFFRSTEKDLVFDGYHIPKDSIIFPCLSSIHRDPKFWDRPHEFYPEHFLTPEGQLRQNVEGFLPFQYGKRMCLGERMAQQEMFVYLVNILHRFDFRLADSPVPTLKGDPKSGAIIRWSSPYKVILEERI